MNSGRYDQQITIEKPTTVDGELGPQPGPWVPLVSLPGSPTVAERFWAEMQDVMPSRSEAVKMGLAVARNQTRCRMPWRSDIDSSMRVTWHQDTDVVYQIVAGPADIGRRKEAIELMLERYSTAGGT
ncbi:MAG TPA: head-tail adaptor protein [Usitatibacter sp.]|nr:head-tail adaptor protein [Usitatibacter sp.]